MDSLLVWVTVALINILVLYSVSFLQQRHRILPVDRIALIAILLSGDVLFITYSVIFDPTQCNGVPIACFVNQNQGVLALGALLVGASTIYVDARLKQVEIRRLEIRQRIEAFRKLQAAVDELIHNLYHYAIELDENLKILSFPSTTFEATFALLEGDTLSYFSPELSSRLYTLQRILTHNHAVLESTAELNSFLKAISLLDRYGTLTISIPDILSQLQIQGANSIGELPLKPPTNSDGPNDTQESDSVLELVSFDDRIITHSVRFVMEVAISQSEDNSLEFPKSLVKMIQNFNKEVTKNESYYYETKSSEAEEEDAANLRSTESRLYCWVKDKEVEGVEVVALRTIIRDIRHTPH